jgi:hypothetical protein
MRKQKVLNPSDRDRVDGRFLGLKSHTDLREAWRITVRCKNDLSHAKILEFPITWDEAVIVALAEVIACGCELTPTAERWRNRAA